jgi:hypothetical protein
LVWFEICHCVLVVCLYSSSSGHSYSLASNNDRDIDGGLLSEALQSSCELLTVHGTSGVGRLHRFVRYSSSNSWILDTYVGLVVYGRHLEGRNGASVLDAIGERCRLGSFEVALEGESGGHDDERLTDY